MAGQLDIFVEAAADNSVPASNWTRPKGDGQYWCEGFGPHASWEDFSAALEPGDRVQVYKDSKGYRAHVYANRDRVTGLWVGHYDEGNSTGASYGLPSYRPAAYRSKEDCIAAWSNLAFQALEKRAKRDEEYIAWRKRFDSDHQRERLARIQADLDADPNPETGEEGMADRFAEES